MWGSSFADLAKKAQALQEQASSMTSGELFNLDAMQSTKPGEGAEKHDDNTATSPTTSTSTTLSFTLPTLSETASPPPPPKQPPPEAKGKLIVPSKKSPKADAKKTQAEDTPQPLLVLTPTDSADQPETDIAEPSQDVEPTTEKENNNNTPEAQEKDPVEEEQEETKQTVDIAQLDHDTTVTSTGSNHVHEIEQQDNEPKANEEVKEEIQDTQKEIQNEQQSETPETIRASLEATPEAVENHDHEQNLQMPPTEQDTSNDNTDAKDPEMTQKEIPLPDSHTDEKEATNESQENSQDVLGEGSNIAPSEKADEATPQAESKVNDGTNDTANVEIDSKEPTQLSPAENTEMATEATTPSMAPAPAGPDAELVKQQFAAQLQRLQASFEEERKEIKLEHQKNLDAALASKDQEMAQVQGKLKEKDTKVRELLRIKEGNELRLDSLKREVEGTKALLSQRHTDVEKFNETNKHEREETDKKIRSMELDHGKTKKELKRVEDELAKTKKELGATNDDFNALKARVKTVAGELKDRRAEVRDLNNKIEELEQANEKLEENISSLGSQISDRDRSGTEKDEEVSELRSTIESLQRQLADSGKKMKAQEGTFENNLASYKRKAQNSLSVANARAAAAIQAKEEAELEARAARSTADSMMAKAMTAESNGKKAIMEAKEYYKEMEEAKIKAEADVKLNQDELCKAKTSLAEMTKQLEALATEKDGLVEEHRRKSRENEVERTKVSNLQQELEQARLSANRLSEDVKKLRQQLQRVESKAATDARAAQSVSAVDEPTSTASAQTAAEDTTSKATIMMLQEQLREKNQSIEELKELLENSLADEKAQGPNGGTGSPPSPQHTNGGKENGAPLFYAIEKQAELNTARNEINRLASLYSDVQSEKFEAQEALQAALRELDEEKAKSQRYEKLSAAPGGTVGGDDVSAATSGRTNVEYLKNIMMSFLNAKTLTEKKALIPVIGAVLCLTPDEQANAIKNVESAGSIEGFGSALFETFGSRVR
ncbi:GRIP domain [Seminavis robusta]|uniref:GRIP domain n=1 Tax=Seminavis robusta TaxID=568900 RepID=A0A9N8EGJ7_9STRA|nr:GRIP domain [Seminavis robusta]|eukprot:Sro961_g225040.1 GRIP domain (1008) ;mRNA; f:34939-38250